MTFDFLDWFIYIVITILVNCLIHKVAIVYVILYPLVNLSGLQLFFIWDSTIFIILFTAFSSLLIQPKWLYLIDCFIPLLHSILEDSTCSVKTECNFRIVPFLSGKYKFLTFFYLLKQDVLNSSKLYIVKCSFNFLLRDTFGVEIYLSLHGDTFNLSLQSPNTSAVSSPNFSLILFISKLSVFLTFNISKPF